MQDAEVVVIGIFGNDAVVLIFGTAPHRNVLRFTESKLMDMGRLGVNIRQR